MTEKEIHMRFYDTSFMDFDMDHAGYSDAMMSLTRYGTAGNIVKGKAFFKKYGDKTDHKHSDLCKECLALLNEINP
jgi:hypothetical protein